MTQTLTYAALDPSTLHVLAVNDAVPAFDDDAAAQRAYVERLLGQTDMRHSHVDLIAIGTLEEIGLIGFLAEGPGVDEAALAPYRARLEVLSGHVLVLYPGAFADDVSLTLGPELTLIATLTQPQTDWSSTEPLTSAAATEQTPPKKKPSDAAMSGRIAMLALLVIGFLTWLMIWIA